MDDGRRLQGGSSVPHTASDDWRESGFSAPRQAPIGPPLTPREREVLAWAAHGKSALDIAAILGIAKRTVDEHIYSSMRKLAAENRTHAVAIAIRCGLIEDV